MSRSLDELLESFLAYLDLERGLSPHTVAAYAQDGRALLAALPESVRASPATLAEKHIFDFIVAERRRGRSVPSVRRSLSAVRTFCRVLLRERVLKANPTANLEAPKTWKVLPDVLEVEEVERILRAVAEHPSRFPHRDRALIELGYATGLRVSEICSLSTGSVHRSLGIV